MFQKILVYPKTFYVNNFLLSILHSYKIYNIPQQEIAAEIVIYSTEKVVITHGDCSLPIFTANDTITNLMQYELSQEESDLLEAGLYYKPSPRILRQHRVLRNLRKNKNIVIIKPDKGNGVVILDRKLYDNAIQEIISDTSKFEKLNEDPTLKREASLQRLLRKLKQKNVFNENESDKSYPSGSAPARIYGTPKMHKFSSSDSFPKLRPIVSSLGTFNYKLRPIVSSIGTFNYNLAQCLCDLLSPLVPNDYSWKDTFSFVSQIKIANLSIKFLVSYDVTSLFTNIPLQETIDIAINLIFNHNHNLNITEKKLKKLFLFATSQTHFIFNSKFYNQIDGAVMGSPLAPVLANIFMGFYESKWLNEYNLNKPQFYLRYVDDILVLLTRNKIH